MSTSMMYSQARRSVADRQSALVRVQQQVATGRAMQRPSDDPASARRVLRAEGLLSEVQENRQTLDEGGRLLSLADGVLANAGDLTQRLAELTVQFASDTYSA
ncbi:MAG: hypothetical protein AAF449_05435, partial [Myxococcota bacterium]